MAMNAWIAPGFEASWGVAGNWSLQAVPVDTNEVVFGTWSQAHVIGGFNQTGVDLASLWTQPEYGGNIGDAANALLIDSTKVRHEGSGLLHFKNDGSMPIMVIDSPNRDQAAIIDGAGGAQLTVKRGVVEVAATCGNVRLMVSYTHSPGDDAIVTLPPSANKLDEFHMSGGIVYNYRNIDHVGGLLSTASMNGGQLYMEGTAAADRIVVHEGTLINNSTGTFVGTFLMGGLCDATQKPGTRTMTTIWIQEGAEFLYSDLVTRVIYDHRNNGPRP